MQLMLIFFAFFSSADQTSLSHYNIAKQYFWKNLYPSKTRQVYKSLYCNKNFVHKKGLNIEHVFAASWMKNSIPECKKLNRKTCRQKSRRFNLMEADLHNLYPTISGANAIRGSLIFGETTAMHFSPTCFFEVGQQVVEPSDDTKGKVARAILYMIYEYGVNLDEVTHSTGFEKEIMQWHCRFKPTEDEIIRNKRISKIQNTLNPFVLDRSFCN